ncbi:MAG: hypothetical protein V5B40_20085 [Candidatus Accumulibacter meliphilus]
MDKAVRVGHWPAITLAALLTGLLALLGRRKLPATRTSNRHQR